MNLRQAEGLKLTQGLLPILQKGLELVEAQR